MSFSGDLQLRKYIFHGILLSILYAFMQKNITIEQGTKFKLRLIITAITLLLLLCRQRSLITKTKLFALTMLNIFEYRTFFTVFTLCHFTP